MGHFGCNKFIKFSCGSAHWCVFISSRVAKEIAYRGRLHEIHPEIDKDFADILEANLEKYSLTYKESERIWRQIRVATGHQTDVSEAAMRLLRCNNRDQAITENGGYMAAL